MARKRKGVISESREQLIRLKEKFRGKPAEKRIGMLLILQHEPYRTFEDIAPKVGSPAPTIKRWWQIYREGGIEKLISPSQRERSVRDRAFILLKKKLANDKLHSIEEVREWIDAQTSRQEASEGGSGDGAGGRARGKRAAPAAGEIGPHLSASAVRLLTSLPLVLEPVSWIRQFSNGLQEFLGDVDRVTIAANLWCDLQKPEEFDPRIAIRQGPDYKEEQVKSLPSEYGGDTKEDHLERFLGDAREHVDIEQYHPPTGFTYYYSRAYAGLIILWRNRSAPPISERTLQTMSDLHDFLLFLLTDVIVRHRYVQPASSLFQQALSSFTTRVELSTQEQRVLAYLLLGYTYKDIARLVNLSENTVRYHIKSIYTKAGVHGLSELFAKYFTVRIDSQ